MEHGNQGPCLYSYSQALVAVTDALMLRHSIDSNQHIIDTDQIRLHFRNSRLRKYKTINYTYKLLNKMLRK